MNLTVIIPVYNVESFLSQCLESVFAISNDILHEVICIDDGSTDGSLSILHQFARQHNNLQIIEQNNSGAAAARNSGIKAATGDYIFFLDADDFIKFPDNLKEICTVSDTHKIDVCFFNAMIDGEKPYICPLPSCDMVISGIEMMRRFYHQCRTIPTPVWIQLYRRQFLIEKSLIQKENSYHEDELFTPVVLSNANNVICIDKAVVHYRFQREGAVTTQYGDKYYSDWANIGRDLFCYFSKKTNICNEAYQQTFGVFMQLIDILCDKHVKVSRYISSNDLKIMQKCAITSFEKKCVKLTFFSFELAHQYHSNTINPILRRMINRFV